MRYLIISIIVLLFVVSCHVQLPLDGMEGELKVRKIVNTTIDVPGRIGGFFIFGSGVVAGEGGRREKTITFAWYYKEYDSYIISTFPLERVIVRLTPIDRPPTIRFYYTRYNVPSTDTMEAVIRYYISTVRITCYEKDWPIDINLPLQGG